MVILKKILIFGMSYHGRAVYRLLDKSINNIIGFVENDINKIGNNFDNIEIFNINSINNIDFDEVIISGRNIDDMNSQLVNDFNIDPKKIRVMNRSDLTLKNKDLEKKENILSEMLHYFINLSLKADVDYWMGFSSLLALKREEKFANFSDIDICIMAEKISLFIDLLNKNSDLYDIFIFRYTNNSNYWKKGDVSSITISQKVDQVVSEPAAIDIVAISRYEDNVYVPGPFNKMHCFPLSHFIGNNSITRFNINFSVPVNAEQYLKLLYGDNWKKPVERWQHKNYKSISLD